VTSSDNSRRRFAFRGGRLSAQHEVTVGSVALGQVASLEAQKLYAKRLQVPATLDKIAR